MHSQLGGLHSQDLGVRCQAGDWTGCPATDCVPLDSGEGCWPAAEGGLRVSSPAAFSQVVSLRRCTGRQGGDSPALPSSSGKPSIGLTLSKACQLPAAGDTAHWDSFCPCLYVEVNSNSQVHILCLPSQRCHLSALRFSESKCYAEEAKWPQVVPGRCDDDLVLGQALSKTLSAPNHTITVPYPHEGVHEGAKHNVAWIKPRNPRTPSSGDPRTPSSETPRIPAQEPPGHPAQEPPGHPAQEPPGHRAQESPGHPALEPPGHPAQEPPGHLAQEPQDTQLRNPRTHSSGTLRTPSSGTPGHPAQEPPGHTAQEPQGHPIRSPRTPSSGAPRTPSSGAPRTPSSGTPRTPSSGVPRTPSSGAPRTPSSGAPRTPSSGAHRTPSSGAHRTPSLGVPEAATRLRVRVH
ncbi:proteoglycan 4-like isoform X2 [Marmota marmota marmota]|uniref:proteoglycan 4-like isoform X2 n=1 Tax=Marmota marmota marmota TaxID=9994 RepID=UPI002092F8CD|nr:proteoglycan 4-like isoform X2 [Marmota marmota marmota]